MLATKVSYLSDLKFNLETWKRELRFHFNEMDTFEEKLEEIAAREYDKRATKKIENFQNRIMIERNEISKLMHRCKRKMNNLLIADYNENIDGRLIQEQRPLKDDMRHYIKMHYDLKEEMMDFFARWL
ncbi:hypothetical protein RXV94_13030 [Yeosuana sp. MJ-SS3]|uniref:Uncharacterized protein n=1 Tax=Gilvirhabdus luticola TaxID=3079858 RepID=A0ABU3U9J2_9FLAO|nr:hypothetical protein [Yeosuana sp. MJ-SS3]MDU8887087.1 hypothetical protein [Yeosuana sp. MJ-SS3]